MVNHYFGTADFVGRSTTADPDSRRAVVEQALDSLRAIPGSEVVVCGIPGRSLVPIDRDFGHLEDPRHLPYATIAAMADEMADGGDGYDWFVNIEDDLLLDAATLTRSQQFARRSRVNEVLLPHRHERRPDGSMHFVDIEAIPGWRRPERRFGDLDLGVAVNEHAGIAVLSAAQLTYAARRTDLSRRDRFHGGYMASAYANLHAPFLVWRTRELARHTITHLDVWLDSPAVPDLGPTLPRGAVDEIRVEGVAVHVRGWALTTDGRPAAVERVRFGATEVEPFRLRRTPRPDVAEVHPAAAEDSGFELTFSVCDLEGEDLTVDRLGVLAHDEDGSLLVPRTTPWPVSDAIAAVSSIPDVPDTPHMPETGIERLAELMSRSKSYLEYGTGGSTMLAIRSGVRQLVAVESDLSWLLALRHRVAALAAPTEVTWRYEDIGPTGDWGAPVDDSAWRRYRRYPLGVWREHWREGGSPDLVVVDGRFRVACAIASLLHAAPGTPILFDDYTVRPQYHHLEHLISPVAVHDRIAELVVPDDLDRGLAWDMLLEAVTDPA